MICRRKQLPHRVFSLREVCCYLHLSQSDVELLMQRQEIPFDKKGDRPIFHKKEVDAWASQRILGLAKTNLANYHRATSPRAHDLSERHAIITELFKEDFVEPALSARTKPSMLRHMVELAHRTGLVTSATDLLQSLEERERLCSTALPDGIALLHPRHHEPYMFDDSFIVMGKAVHPLPFGAPDGKMTDIFLLICCQDDRIHLHVLARICMMCRQTTLLRNLRNATDSATISESVRQSEADIIRRA